MKQLLRALSSNSKVSRFIQGTFKKKENPVNQNVLIDFMNQSGYTEVSLKELRRMC